MSEKFYGEFGTDRFVRENFFPDRAYKGTVVEVGAGPPSFISNSKHFRESGWRSICVEPNPKFAQQHRDAGSEVYEYACSDTEGVSQFTVNLNKDNWYTEENDGVSFSALEIRHEGLPEHNEQHVIEVKTTTLDNILLRAGVGTVDFLSIDVEGWELSVLSGFSIDIYKPKVVVLENIPGDPAYAKYMSDHDYKLIQKIRCNEFYVRKKMSHKNDTKNRIIETYNDYNNRYGMWGFCSLDKAGLIIDYIDDLCNTRKVDPDKSQPKKSPVCVEIGVFGGMSVLPAAMELQRHGRGIVYAIDPWSNDEATKGYDGKDLDWWSKIDLEKYMNIHLDSVKEFELDEYVETIRSTSDDARTFEKIDFLYIDGQHTEQAIKDAMKYATKVTPGGYVIIDDIDWGEVKKLPKVIEELGFKWINSVGTAYMYQKVSNKSKWDEVNLSDSFLTHFKKCDCIWCTEYEFPRLTELSTGDHWFEIPKNASASIKRRYSVDDRSILTKSQYKDVKKPVVVFRDPIDRFVTLLNDYLSQGSYHWRWGQDLFLYAKKDWNNAPPKERIDILFEYFDLFTDHHQPHHWYPQTYFIDQSFKDIEVVWIQDASKRFDLDDSRKVNKSKKTITRDMLSPEQIAILKEVYASDYKFIEERTNKIFFTNPYVQNSAWIVDNFYQDPDAVREFALKQKFVEGGIGRGFIGRRTEEQFLFDGLKEKFESIMGKTITKWQQYGMNGRFQVAWSGEPLVWHCDSQLWGGMLYLTPDAPYQCGTTLYAHKKTRARSYRMPGWDEAWKGIPGDSHLDGTHFEPVDVLGNVYNRLVIFDAACIHSASEYFGTVMDNSRLWQMFFFDAVDN